MFVLLVFCSHLHSLGFLAGVVRANDFCKSLQNSHKIVESISLCCVAIYKYIFM